MSKLRISLFLKLFFFAQNTNTFNIVGIKKWKGEKSSLQGIFYKFLEKDLGDFYVTII